MTTYEPDIEVSFYGTMTLHEKADATGPARLVNFGDTVVFDETLIEANRDRLGHVLVLDLLDDEEAQVAKYGKIRFTRGPWPEGVSRIEKGSFAWDDARARAKAEVEALHSEPERKAGRERVREEFGLPDDAYSKTLAVYHDHR